MKRNSNHRHATRVIAATHHHFKMVKGLSTERGDLKHNVSMGLLIISTVLTLFGSIVRVIVVFQAREHKFASPAESIWFGYLCWGVLKASSVFFTLFAESILDSIVLIYYLKQSELSLLPTIILSFRR